MSRLPPELEIQIFESAARDSPFNPQLRLTLMLVASRVKIWVEPFVYQCLAFSAVNNWDRLKHIVATKPPDFLAKHVKSIYMPRYVVTMQEAAEILLACTGVQRTLALCRLSMELSHFLCLPADLRNTQTLTHLELVHWEAKAERYPDTLDLARFSHLTHLGLRSDGLRFRWPVPMVSSMVFTCHRLRVLVLLDYTIGIAEGVRRALNDPRAVLVLSQVTLHDWEPMAKSFSDWDLRLGKGDMWARGEDIIRRNLPS
ncbi:hypothetical protein K438DRAFT_1835193 [Mycena galopus ATCC 62051]|nr:hypothetical protein K438DRAFT_1835193 [Mycena galopus ATCC 62051]